MNDIQKNIKIFENYLNDMEKHNNLNNSNIFLDAIKFLCKNKVELNIKSIGTQ